MINMTPHQLQWDRLTEMAQFLKAPPEFWVAYKAIVRPKSGQIELGQLEQLRALMIRFQLSEEKK